MTPSNEQLDVPHDYLIGLIDYLCNPRLAPRETAGGYGLDPSLTITTRDSQLIEGIIVDSLEQSGIRTTSENRSSGTRVRIRNNESLIEVSQLGRGDWIQIAERLSFLSFYANEYGGKNISADRELFLRLYKTWAELHSYWSRLTNKKYTFEYFKKEFQLDETPVKKDFPETTYPDQISTEYVAGMFDAKGRIRFNTSENSEWDIGYSMSPAAGITLSHPEILVKPHLLSYWEDKPYSPRIHESEDQLRISITTLDGIEAFIEDIGPHLYYNYEMAQFVYEQAIPAFRDGYHKNSRAGFLDLLEAHETYVKTDGPQKYNSEYLKDLWDMG
ncbi:hypothetical protein [Halobaculum rubrum]|uniref:hypothetical protein n=1 Tax=Halobaculum rubrum TaxID=2872158 RepID=UPI001CA3BB49|nr:hypothetical protein [Halobaculum rubrum]QZY01202.1 hypothetical protein K6T25_15175 [Halobaculum rubrum]